MAEIIVVGVNFIYVTTSKFFFQLFWIWSDDKKFFFVIDMPELFFSAMYRYVKDWQRIHI